MDVQTVETHHDAVVVAGPEGSGAATAQVALRLAIVEREPLVAATVSGALETRGVEVSIVPWSDGGDKAQVRRGVAAAHADMVLLMTPLSPWPLLREAQALVLGSTERWLLLTVTPPGPAWGAMLDAGVEAALPSSTGLDDTVAALERSVAGRPVMDAAVEARLRQEWHGMTAELALMRSRLDRLSPREAQVLARLYDGDVVRQVAERLGVTQHTVRTQVKSVMRKLEVNTQLAAVAVYGWVMEHPLIGGESL